MEIRINQLKLNFTHIIDIRTQVISIFDILQIRIDKLKLIYADFIKSNRDNLFIFGLDSFHFQSKILDIEYDDMKRLFLAINNRIYCEYFKLYNIIVAYVCDTIKDKKALEMFSINNSFPVYKDLEPFKQYKFEVVQEIHENILVLLSSTNNYIINKEHELKLHQGKQEIGLNIDNFVNTFSFSVSTIRDKTLLFITYVEFFHKLHTKYLRRFASKVQSMYNQINSDINFDENNGATPVQVSTPVATKSINKLQNGVKKVISGLGAFKQLTKSNDNDNTNEIVSNSNEIVSNEIVSISNKIVSNEIVSNEIVSNEIVSNEIVSNEIVSNSNEIVSNEIVSNSNEIVSNEKPSENIEVVMTNSFKEETNVLLEIIEANKPPEEKPISTLMDEIEKKCDEINQEVEEIHIVEDNVSILTQEEESVISEVKKEEEEKVVEEPIKKRGRPKKNK